MRHYLLAIALAAASLSFTGSGHAGGQYAVDYYGAYQQKCFTKRIATEDLQGKRVTKRVRICQ
jgi:hypothetical protein